MAPPRTNLELVQSVYDAFSGGDHAALLEALDPDVEWLPMRAILEGKGVRGRDAVARLLGEEGVLTDLDVEAEKLTPVGDDRVLALVRLRGRGRASGVETEEHLADLWTLRDGRVCRFEVFSHADEARRAAGLDE